jgi:hypothetical protein
MILNKETHEQILQNLQRIMNNNRFYYSKKSEYENITDMELYIQSVDIDSNKDIYIKALDDNRQFYIIELSVNCNINIADEIILAGTKIPASISILTGPDVETLKKI